MLKLVIGLMLLIGIIAAAARLMSHAVAIEKATPQHLYLRMHHDDELVAKP